MEKDKYEKLSPESLEEIRRAGFRWIAGNILEETDVMGLYPPLFRKGLTVLKFFLEAEPDENFQTVAENLFMEALNDMKRALVEGHPKHPLEDFSMDFLQKLYLTLKIVGTLYFAGSPGGLGPRMQEKWKGWAGAGGNEK